MISVTGDAGFIATKFVLDWLGRELAGVISLNKLTYAGNLSDLEAEPNDKRHIFVHGGIGDQALVEKLIAKHTPWAIVHFAAESHDDRSIHGHAASAEINVGGNYEFLETAKSYWTTLEALERAPFRFQCVSTDEVYGSLN